MVFKEDKRLTARGVSYQIQKMCYLSNQARIEMALSLPLPVQPNAFVNGNQNAHPNANLNANQIAQTAVNTMVQPNAQTANQNSHQGITDDDGHDTVINNNAMVTGGKKPKVPMNGWMTFRSYHQKAPMFTGFPQGLRSRILSKFWDQEPFRAKLDIMGKAFTRIRDFSGVPDVQVSDFFDICAPLMRVLKMDDYFEFGLKYTLGADGEVHLMGELTIPNKDLYNTNISANDLIRACHEQGFFEGEVSGVYLPEDQFEQGGAGASNQTHSPWEGSQRYGHQKQPNNDSVPVPLFRFPQGYLEAKAARQTLHPSQFSPGGCPAQQNALLSKSSAYSLGSIKYQRRALNDNYPYYASFDPDQKTPYVYRPWNGGAFDAFELGDGFSDAHDHRP